MGNWSPCQDCVAPKRTPECHGTCKEYKKWKASEKVKKDAERERKEQENAVWASYKPKRR